MHGQAARWTQLHFQNPANYCQSRTARQNGITRHPAAVIHSSSLPSVRMRARIYIKRCLGSDESIEYHAQTLEIVFEVPVLAGDSPPTVFPRMRHLEFDRLLLGGKRFYRLNAYLEAITVRNAAKNLTE